MFQAGLTWSCYHSLVSRSLFFLFFFFLLTPIPSSRSYPSGMLQQQGLVERKVRRSAGDSLRRRGRPSWVFAATASTAWSHDLRVSKMSEGTRKSGQKEKEEEEEEEQNIEEDEEGGREGDIHYCRWGVVQRAAGNMRGALRGLPVSV